MPWWWFPTCILTGVCLLVGLGCGDIVAIHALTHHSVVFDVAAVAGLAGGNALAVIVIGGIMRSGWDD